MAVVREGTDDFISAFSTTGFTQSYTVAAGSNLLIAKVAYNDTASEFWDATDPPKYDGVAMTQLGSRTGDQEVWYLVGPSTGANDLVVKYTGTFGTGATGVVIADFSGVDQTTPFGTEQFATNSSTTSISDTVTDSVTGDLVISFYHRNNNSPSQVSEAAMTDVVNHDWLYGGNLSIFATTTDAGGTVTVGFEPVTTWSATVNDMRSVAIKQAVAAVPGDDGGFLPELGEPPSAEVVIYA